jgi:hypothetical protein
MHEKQSLGHRWLQQDRSPTREEKRKVRPYEQASGGTRVHIIAPSHGKADRLPHRCTSKWGLPTFPVDICRLRANAHARYGCHGTNLDESEEAADCSSSAGGVRGWGSSAGGVEQTRREGWLRYLSPVADMVAQRAAICGKSRYLRRLWHALLASSYCAAFSASLPSWKRGAE